MSQIVWMDTETTGLEPTKCGIIELAAVIQYPGRNKPADYYSEEMNPGAVEISEYALKVNQISEEKISAAAPIDQALRLFDGLIEDRAVIAGWNVSGFDIPFLKTAYERAGIKWRFHHHCLDMMVVANWLKFVGAIHPKSLSLQNMAKYLGIDAQAFGPAHRAMPDVYTTLAIAKRFKEEHFNIQRKVGF